MSAKLILALFTIVLMENSFAKENSDVSEAKVGGIYRIEVGSDYQKHSQAELQRRVWQLERAAWQLQQRVFELELAKNNPKQPAPDTWVCTIVAMGDNYAGTGASKAIATQNAIDKCTKARNGESFFCKNPHCEH